MSADAERLLGILWGTSEQPPGRLAVSWKKNGKKRGLETRAFDDCAKASSFTPGDEKSDVWMRVTATGEVAEGRGKAEDAIALPALYLDLDVKPGGFATIDDAKALLRGLPLWPTMIVESGGGLQPYWAFHEPLSLTSKEEREDAARLLKGWQAFVAEMASERGASIDSVADLARILRLPGTLNFKYDPPRRVRLAFADPERRYDPSDFEPFLREQPAVEAESDDEAEQLPPTELTRIRSALAFCGDAGDREAWLRVGMALHSTGAGEQAYGLWAEWSQQSEKFDPQDQRRVWASLSSKTSAVRLGSLFNLAQSNGWRQAKLPDDEGKTRSVTLEEFEAYLPDHKYVWHHSREHWPAASVNSQFAPQPDLDPASGDQRRNARGELKWLTPAQWLDRNRPVVHATWAPGEPFIIEDRMLDQGGWIAVPGERVLNTYREPTIELGDADKAELWLEHARRVFPHDWQHVVSWMAHRVQKPWEKVNHALVLGGAQGVGKDTLLKPLRDIVGPTNYTNVSPKTILGGFNKFVKSVVLQVDEVRDLGPSERFMFYDHMKSYTAAPPDGLLVNEKYRQEYVVPNVCGVIFTTNYKTGGLFLHPEDRRHHVAWSPLVGGLEVEKACAAVYRWYEDPDSTRHVAALLRGWGLGAFDAKAPPRKTRAFWEIAESSRATEDAELFDVVEELGRPDALIVSDMIPRVEHELRVWLTERRNSRVIPHRLAEVGYVRVRNDDVKDGYWKVAGKRVAIYARDDLSLDEQVEAARERADKYS